MKVYLASITKTSAKTIVRKQNIILFTEDMILSLMRNLTRSDSHGAVEPGIGVLLNHRSQCAVALV